MTNENDPEFVRQLNAFLTERLVRMVIDTPSLQQECGLVGALMVFGQAVEDAYDGDLAKTLKRFRRRNAKNRNVLIFLQLLEESIDLIRKSAAEFENNINDLGDL